MQLIDITHLLIATSKREARLSNSMSRPNVSYNLHTLGWMDFQNLSGTVLREILGQTLQQFADTSDAGRDGAFHGKWKPQGQETLSGSFVLQCKFTARPNASLQVSELNEELLKARKLASKGLCQNYILITNASMRAPVEADLKEKFESIRGIKHFAAFDGNWLTQQIRENQRLRILVPRIYGLGDLTEILDERVYQQAQEVLSWLGDELARFVITDAHHRSVKALQEKRFVFLLGEVRLLFLLHAATFTRTPLKTSKNPRFPCSKNRRLSLK